MEVRSESGIMSGREPFSVSMQKTTPLPSSQLPPKLPSMRLAYAPDGTAVYKPLPPYQGGGSGADGGGGGGAAGGAVATAVATTVAAAPAGGNGNSSTIPPPTPHGLNISMGEPLKRKRGRPRKYGPDGTMALAMVPVNPAAAGTTPVSGTFSPTSPPGSVNPLSASSSAPAIKKARGRPPGSGRKQQMDALGSAGIGFTPHVITVKAGEDVSSKIMSFSQHGPRAVCILSANGAISNVTLRQAATSGGTVTYEGRFEILSLSGSFLLSESGGQRSRTGGLSVSLAGPDGRVLGGGVAGLLTAASPVQVVVGSFIADGRKESRSKISSDPASAPGKLATGVMTGATSPPSRGTMSESSGGPGSPVNQSTGACNNSNQQGMPSMPWK